MTWLVDSFVLGTTENSLNSSGRRFPDHSAVEQGRVCTTQPALPIALSSSYRIANSGFVKNKSPNLHLLPLYFIHILI